jgi:uncharacterized protein YjbI with pentapeptide repeats
MKRMRMIVLALNCAVLAAPTLALTVDGCDILPGASCASADWSGKKLGKVDLSGANLSKANLSRVNLAGANLSGACL